MNVNSAEKLNEQKWCSPPLHTVQAPHQVVRIGAVLFVLAKRFSKLENTFPTGGGLFGFVPKWLGIIWEVWSFPPNPLWNIFVPQGLVTK
jgi:hypothetical protein